MQIAVAASLRKRDSDNNLPRVGCALRQSRIHGSPLLISIGWNDRMRVPSMKTLPKKTRRRSELHAEVNAIFHAAHSRANLFGATAYITHFPCYECACQLIHAGVDRIIFLVPLDRYSERTTILMRSQDVSCVPLRYADKFMGDFSEDVRNSLLWGSNCGKGETFIYIDSADGIDSSCGYCDNDGPLRADQLQQEYGDCLPVDPKFKFSFTMMDSQEQENRALEKLKRQ